MTGPLRWLLRQDQGPEHLRRATWAAVAGLTGFYTLRYGFGAPGMALYALFGALPLTLFSQVPGAAQQRTRTFLAVLPAGWVLVTAGTLLAAHSWSAACGMFVVGFTASFLGVGGPRLGGLASAFQLYYLLPCFPPYAPGTLGERLGGLTVGILLTALVDRLLWRDEQPVPYRVLLADAVDAVAGYCASTGRLMAGSGAGDGEAADRSGAQRDQEAAYLALQATLLSRVAPAERPTSASLRDRACYDVRAAVRHVRAQLDRLLAGARGPDPAAAHLLDRTAAALRGAARVLRSGSPGPRDDALATALSSFRADRARRLAGVTALRLRQDSVVQAAATGALLAGEGARIAFGAPLDARWQRPGGPFPYAALRAPARWWRRLRLHLTPRSVLLQNALRLAFALAVARLIVGALDLPHGFWVLLAIISLMRTSAAGTRGALTPTFLGVAVGAALATLMLVLVGDTPAFYIAAAPVVFLVGFSVGPVLGTAWTQAALTLVLILLFAQILPPDRQLPAVRLLDVVIGGSLGAAASLVAWPKGAGGELRRAVVNFMVRGAEACKAVTLGLCHGYGYGGGYGGDRAHDRTHDRSADPLRPAHAAMLLAQAAHTQYRTEHAGRERATPPWETAMQPGHHTVSGGGLLLAEARRDGEGAVLPADATALLVALADRVAGDCLRATEFVRSAGADVPELSGPYPAAESAPLHCAVAQAQAQAQAQVRAQAPDAGADADPATVLLVADIEAWLTGVAHDAALVVRRAGAAR
ncbi:FUSC family protein [Streptomyces rectiverticillatus]|uniref:FUSC family protein n=1 Tax=Streptomyces rectiverticillatus TaxID=173860 RepID=UPI0015C33DD8|nr:FUSC family protein [Streptomyces rectiverticillatus]QLE70561.1 FUSC family protein [Streptomyces rectiverticillatus]